MSEIVAALTAEQIEQIRDLVREYHAALPQQYRPRLFEAELAALPGAYAPPKGVLLLAMVAGQPVGCVGLRPFPLEGACEMKRLYVRPTFRGAEVGKFLVQWVVQQACARGYSRLRLDTHPPTMAAAVAMYRKLGFREVMAEPLDRVEGLLYMELLLTPAPISSSGLRAPIGIRQAS